MNRFCLLNSSYPLYEITATVFKEEAIQQKFDHPDFAKYFKIK